MGKHSRRAARQARFPAGFGEAENRPAVREGIAHKARVAPRVRSGAEGGRSGTGDRVRRRKNIGFSLGFRQISAGFISRQPAMNLSIGVKEKVRKNIQGRGEIPQPNRRANK